MGDEPKTCKRGHVQAGDNLYVSPGGQVHCKPCRTIRIEAARPENQPGWIKECPSGHPRTIQSTYRLPDGTRGCWKCRHAGQAAELARRREFRRRRSAERAAERAAELARKRELREAYCSNGHPRTEGNTRVYRGYRQCRDCRLATEARRAQQHVSPEARRQIIRESIERQAKQEARGVAPTDWSANQGSFARRNDKTPSGDVDRVTGTGSPVGRRLRRARRIDP